MYLLDANIFAHVFNFFSTGETGFAIILLKMQCAHLLFIKLHDQKMLFFWGGGGFYVHHDSVVTLIIWDMTVIRWFYFLFWNKNVFFTNIDKYSFLNHLLYMYWVFIRRYGNQDHAFNLMISMTTNVYLYMQLVFDRYLFLLPTIYFLVCLVLKFVCLNRCCLS